MSKVTDRQIPAVTSLSDLARGECLSMQIAIKEMETTVLKCSVQFGSHYLGPLFSSLFFFCNRYTET